MSEMVERVAKAVGEVLYGAADPVDTPNNWARSMDAARAAITAMREPTEEMRQRGGSTLLLHEYEPDGPEGSRDVWQSMIDAALAERK